MNLNRLKFPTLLLAICVLTLCAFTAFSYRRSDAATDLHTIRKLLIKALDSKTTTDSLYTSLASIKNRPPIINGYLGALEALKAKHTWNPYYKVKYLNDSEDTFKNAVATDPQNIEIRFMRFSIENNVPGFLGYNKNLVADRLEMIKQIDNKNYTSRRISIL